MKRSKSQRIGSQGQRLVQYIVETNGAWIIRSQEEDYGIDLEAELTNTRVSGQFLKIQVKSSRQVSIQNGLIKKRIERKFLTYAESCRVPIVLVVADITNEIAWYAYLQQWIVEQRTNGQLQNTLSKTVQVEIPEQNLLSVGLDNELRTIACWETGTQLFLSLQDALRTAISIEDTDVASSLFDILGKADEFYHNFPLDLLIEQVLKLGGRIWGTTEGNQTSGVLYSMCRMLGGQFNTEHIVRLVARGEGVSRVGINALGVLYDSYPHHIAQLDLPNRFRCLGLVGAVYYCKLREKYLGMDSISLMSGNIDYKIDHFDIRPSSKDRLFDKWVNRGDSALLDYLYEQE